MQPYIYGACHTTLLEQEIDYNLDTKKLILELNHKYGLKVFSKTEVLKNPKSWGTSAYFYLKTDVRDWKQGVANGDYEEVDAFLLTYEGMSNAMVWTANNKEHGLTYYFYSPSYYKEKSSNNVDHHTLRSVKLPTLINNIKKNGALPPRVPISLQYTTHISDLVGDVDRILNKKGHNNINSNTDLQMLLKIIKGDMKLSECDDKLIKKIDETHAYMNDIDKEAIEVKTSLKDVLAKEFHIILTYEHDGYIVGRGRVKYNSDNKVDEKEWLEYTSPLQRVNSLDDYDEIDQIRPLLIMRKLKLESVKDNKSIKKDYFILEDEYDNELRIVSKSKDRWNGFDDFNHLAMFIPKE